MAALHISTNQASVLATVDNQTVRNVFVIGPDKKVKLVLIPDDHRPELRRSASGHRLAPTDGQPPGGDANQLAAGRGCGHCRFGFE
jgi:hypothetical protein